MPEAELSDPGFHLDTEGVLRARLLEAEPWLEHGFGTRLAGYWPGAPLLLKQVHSGRVIEAGAFPPGEPADGVIANQPGLWLPVRTADCLPILMADPVHHAVGAIHAGWRGVVSGIVVNTVAAMSRRYGTLAAELLAVIGPGIGVCCFEVGPDVAQLFQTAQIDSQAPQPGGPLPREHLETALGPRNDLRQKTHINLADIVVRQLNAAGVSMARLYRDHHCTFCDPTHFHSWRRDRDAAGRMVSAIRLRK